MKFLYGMLALAVLAFVASFLIGSEANKVQIDAGPVVPPQDQYDPVDAGEPKPGGMRQLLPRDAILPVYNPTFRTAATTEWPDDILVIGVELDGESKAYPVSFLNRREMVIDWIGGTPVLVTW